MRDVNDFAKYFIKIGADSMSNTFDGNMKLQKLLYFSNLINVVKNHKLLFNEDVLAFKNGCVIESVRQRYKRDYVSFFRESELFEPNFSDEEKDVLNIVMDIFGDVSAKELSDINHTFRSWKEAYQKGTQDNDYHDKGKSVVNMFAFQDDIKQMEEILSAYYAGINSNEKLEVINGVKFHYDFNMTDNLLDELERFSLVADENEYTAYLDDGRMVIY